MKAIDRGAWQRAIEDEIVIFNGDAGEATELLDAILGALKGRYDRGETSDVEHEAQRLREALDELDRTTTSGGGVSKDDLEAYRDWQARHEEE